MAVTAKRPLVVRRIFKLLKCWLVYRFQSLAVV
jgi:hypothetical protein